MFLRRIWAPCADYPTSSACQHRPASAVYRRIYMCGHFGYISRCVRKGGPATKAPQSDFSLKSQFQAPLTPFSLPPARVCLFRLYMCGVFAGRGRAPFEGVAGFRIHRSAFPKIEIRSVSCPILGFGRPHSDREGFRRGPPNLHVGLRAKMSRGARVGARRPLFLCRILVSVAISSPPYPFFCFCQLLWCFAASTRVRSP